ncbi:protein draper-like isoform X2 [Saccostrea cucullata]|uniref:protein draper-like isoform X2 n=1 Tax=Saccostrea cuccullata TaxID=36930 RepID=UPI002ED59687
MDSLMFFRIIVLSSVGRSSGFEDLSMGKTASQSSTPPCLNEACRTFYISANAVDRDKSTCTRNTEIGRLSNTKTVWWRVDLGAVYSIYSINVLFKNYNGYELRQRGRFAGFFLYLSNSSVRYRDVMCYKDDQELPPLNFTTTCVGHGRYVTFYNQRLDENQYPDGYQRTTVTELCEVIVYGCSKAGVYGRHCKQKCPANCQEQRCDIINGTCLGCLPGWTGTLCEIKCSGGWYGLECKVQCFGHCRLNAYCNHVTGQCDNECDEGWKGIYCEERCEEGYYGVDCKYNCSGHCRNNDSCNKETGHCDKGCEAGYTNNFCNSVCPVGHFGSRCMERCSGHCLNDSSCDHIDGVCANGCDNGYIEDRCNKMCDNGYYGRNCSQMCSPKCMDTCLHTDGSCICVTGWMGINCSQECSSGFYGINCEEECSSHCGFNDSCDRYSGSCPRGCQETYTGPKCSQLTGNCSQLNGADA